MNVWFAYKMAVRCIFDNKSRSALTMLGVIIGVAAVIIAVGFAQGCMAAVTNQIEGLGSNSITAMIMSRSSSRQLTLDDCEKLQEYSQYIEKVSPYILTTMNVKSGAESKATRILGADASYLDLQGLKIEEGRYLTQSDIDKNEKVAIIGSTIVNKLFEGDKALGEYLRINGNKFLIVGVLESTANGMEGTNDDMVIIPINVAQRTLKITSVTMFLANATSNETLDLATQKIKDFLFNIFKDDDSYVVFTQEAMLGIMDTISNIMMLILGSIATISLVVGGIGIMNIMLVSVSERTREIGIRKAIGAKKKDIMIQFLIESLLLTGIGGVIGVIIGLLTIKYGVGAVDLLEPVYSVPWTIAAFMFSLVIGVMFGLFPANKAANLHPIDALRNE